MMGTFARRLSRPDLLRRFKSIHFGHLAIHQDQIEIFRPTLSTASCPLHTIADVAPDAQHAWYLLIDEVILRQQDAEFLLSLRLLYIVAGDHGGFASPSFFPRTAACRGGAADGFGRKRKSPPLHPRRRVRRDWQQDQGQFAGLGQKRMWRPGVPISGIPWSSRATSKAAC
jgi:hypothetical protein